MCDITIQTRHLKTDVKNIIVHLDDGDSVFEGQSVAGHNVDLR